MSRMSMKTQLPSGVSASLLIGASLLLSACSSNVTRFDYPAMGYNSDDQDLSSFNGGFGGSSSPKKSPRKFSDYNTYNNDAYASSGSENGTSSNKVASYNRGNVQSESVSELSKQRYQPRRISDFNQKPATEARSGQSVKVQSGDTLYSISRRYGLKPADFMAANNMSDYTIRVGQRLKVPGTGQEVAANRPRKVSKPRSQFQYASNRSGKKATSHRVNANETLYTVARKHGVSYVQLAQWNGLDHNATLRVGQVLSLKPTARRAQRVAKLRDGLKTRSDAGSNGLWAAQKPKKVVVPKVARVKPVKLPKVAAYKAKNKRVARHKKSGFRWPVRGRIIAKFGPMANGKNNDGVNFAVPMGTEVKAAENGVVAYAGSELKGYGNLVLIRHANNFVSAYAHNSALKVKRGDRIKRGAVVALAGKSGDVSQPQLHFELRKGAKPIDPTQYMSQ